LAFRPGFYAMKFLPLIPFRATCASVCLILGGAVIADAQTSAPAAATPPTSTATAIPSASPTAAPAAATSAATPAAALGRGRGGALPADPNLPTIWTIGDSTVLPNAGNGSGGQWGWGDRIGAYFDTKKINVVNRGVGGTSSRTYYTGQWPRVLPNIKKGDFVFMQFGHNDKNGNLTGGNATIASLNGVGDETQEVTNRSGQPDTVHTFGWYMKQYVNEVRAKGATPIICSLIPRKLWEADGKLMRHDPSYFDYAGWAAQVAKENNVLFVNLHEITARKYEAMGPDKVQLLFGPQPTEHTHTNLEGAVINAESVIGGLKALKDDPLANYFSEQGQAVPVADVSQPAPPPVVIPKADAPKPDAAPAAVAPTATSAK
jgi:lysophospholipase L1-like esterase